MSNLLLDRFRNNRVTPFIRPGKSELITGVMGGGFPAMLQGLIRAGPRIMDNRLFV